MPLYQLLLVSALLISNGQQLAYAESAPVSEQPAGAISAAELLSC